MCLQILLSFTHILMSPNILTAAKVRESRVLGNPHLLVNGAERTLKRRMPDVRRLLSSELRCSRFLAGRKRVSSLGENGFSCVEKTSKSVLKIRSCAAQGCELRCSFYQRCSRMSPWLCFSKSARALRANRAMRRRSSLFSRLSG